MIEDIATDTKNHDISLKEIIILITAIFKDLQRKKPKRYYNLLDINKLYKNVY